MLITQRLKNAPEVRMVQQQTEATINARPIEERVFDADATMADGWAPVLPGEENWAATTAEALFAGPPRRAHIANLSHGSDTVPVYDFARPEALAIRKPTNNITFVLPSHAEVLSGGRVHPDEYQPQDIHATGWYDLAFTDDDALVQVISRRHGHIPNTAPPKTIGKPVKNLGKT